MSSNCPSPLKLAFWCLLTAFSTRLIALLSCTGATPFFMDFKPSAHQAAGHDGCLTSGAVFAKLTTQQEIDFYAETLANAVDADLGSHLSHWMPTYMGTLTEDVVNGETLESKAEQALQATAKDKVYVVLQNLYYGFEKPSILDIKLGAVLVDDTVAEEKRLRLAKVSESTTSGSLHFRVCGMKLYGGETGDKPEEVFDGMHETVEVEETSAGNYFKFNKFYGRTLSKENAKEGIAHYLSYTGKNRTWLLSRFHQRLQLLYNCLLDAEVRIKSGSLFFIFENDPRKWEGLDESLYMERDPLVNEALEDDDEEDSECPLSSLSFIDFAHAKYTEGEGPDENVIVGVENLIRIFAELLAEH